VTAYSTYIVDPAAGILPITPLPKIISIPPLIPVFTKHAY